jgi:hypothetical protein
MVLVSGFDRDLYIDVFLLVHPLFVPSVTVLDHLRQTYVLFCSFSPFFFLYFASVVWVLTRDMSRLAGTC